MNFFYDSIFVNMYVCHLQISETIRKLYFDFFQKLHTIDNVVRCLTKLDLPLELSGVTFRKNGYANKSDSLIMKYKRKIDYDAKLFF